MDSSYYKNLIKKNSGVGGLISTSAGNQYKLKDKVNIKHIDKIDDKLKPIYNSTIKKEIERLGLDIKQYPILIVKKLPDQKGRLTLIGLTEDGEPSKDLLIDQNFVQKARTQLSMKEHEEQQESLSKNIEAQKKEAKDLGISIDQYLKLKREDKLEAFKESKKIGNIDDYLEKFNIPKDLLKENPSMFKKIKEKVTDILPMIDKRDATEAHIAEQVDRAFAKRDEINELNKQLKNPIALQDIVKKINSFDYMFNHELKKAKLSIENLGDKELSQKNREYVNKAYQALTQAKLKPSKEVENAFKTMVNPTGKNLEEMIGKKKNPLINFLAEKFNKSKIPLSALKNSKDALPHYKQIMDIYNILVKENKGIIPPQVKEYFKQLKYQKDIFDKADKRAPMLNANKMLGTRENMPKEAILEAFNKKMAPILKKQTNPVNNYEDLENDPEAKKLIDAFRLVTQNSKKQGFGTDALQTAWNNRAKGTGSKIQP